MVSFKTKSGKVVSFTPKNEQKPTGILGYKTKGIEDDKSTDSGN